MTLNDRLWDMLDKMHLGATFDKYKIPPIVFPIAVIAIVAIIVFLFTDLGQFMGSEQPQCGDGLCSEGEDPATCPDDCQVRPPTPAAKSVRVSISGVFSCTSLSVKLKDSSGSVLETKEITTHSVSFDSVKADRVYVEVSSPQSTRTPVRSDTIATATAGIIRIDLPDDYCPRAQQKGNLRVSLENAVTGESIAATVTLFDSDGTNLGTRYVATHDTFTNLDSGYYYVTATSNGYSPYSSQGDNTLVEAGQTVTKVIRMTPTSTQPTPQPPGPMLPTGYLQVCIDSDGPVPASGEISIYDIDGTLKTTGRITDSNCPLGRGGSANARCYKFTLPVGQQFKAQVTQAPSGCTISEQVGPFLIKQGQTETTTIDLECNLTGRVRAVLYGNETNGDDDEDDEDEDDEDNENREILTEECLEGGNCTIEIYYEKKNKRIKALELDEDDSDYTEWVSVPADTKLYFKVKIQRGSTLYGHYKSPEESRNFKLSPKEEKTIGIILQPPPPPQPNLEIHGLYIAGSRYSLYQNESFAVVVDTIKLNSTESGGGVTVLTNASGVTLQCEGSWGQKVNAVYNNSKWRCNMTAPNTFGAKSILVRATKRGADPASATLHINVISSERRRLIITQDLAASATAVSPVTLAFNITRQVNATTTAPVNSLDKSELKVGYMSALSGLVVNTTLQKTGPGKFRAQFDVPFKGVYVYNLRAEVIIGNYTYEGSLSDYFRNRAGAPGAISCAVSKPLVVPGGAFNVSAEFRFNNQPFAGQRMAVLVTGKDQARWTMDWNAQTKKYESEAVAGTDECKYEVICYSVEDPAVNSSANPAYVYVVNPSAGGLSIDGRNCPLISGCTNNLTNARECFKYSRQSNTLPSDYTYAVDCAKAALAACTRTVVVPPVNPNYATCKLPIKFKVKAAGDYERTTPSNMVAIDSPTGPAGIRIGYAKPSVTGTVAYSLVDVEVPGRKSAGPIAFVDSGTVQLRIDSRTGDVTAWTFCPQLNCSATLGDLNGNRALDTGDVSLFIPLLDSLNILGQPIYNVWPPACADVDRDGNITDNDRDCLMGQMLGQPCTQTCRQARGTSYSTTEICNDGVDNDCDGQRDADTYNNKARQLYGSGGAVEDLCSCTPSTPCDMLRSSTGGILSTQSSESNVYRCASLSYLNNGAYYWYGPDQWKCNRSRNGESLVCGGVTYACNGVSWVKLGGQGTFPPNPKSAGAGSVFHRECNDQAKTCVQTAGWDQNECDLGQYWGDCAHGVCNRETAACTIYPGPGASECNKSSDCLGVQSPQPTPPQPTPPQPTPPQPTPSQPLRTVGPTTEGSCPSGYAVVNWSCSGDCGLRPERTITCAPLPAGVITGVSNTLAAGDKGACSSWKLNSVMTGFKYEAYQNQYRYSLICTELDKAALGVVTRLPATEGTHDCGDAFVVGFDCPGGDPFGCEIRTMSVNCSKVTYWDQQTQSVVSTVAANCPDGFGATLYDCIGTCAAADANGIDDNRAIVCKRFPPGAAAGAEQTVYLSASGIRSADIACPAGYVMTGFQVSRYSTTNYKYIAMRCKQVRNAYLTDERWSSVTLVEDKHDCGSQFITKLDWASWYDSPMRVKCATIRPVGS